MLSFVALLTVSLKCVGLCGCQSDVSGFVAILAVSRMCVGLCGYFSCQSDVCQALWLFLLSV